MKYPDISALWPAFEHIERPRGFSSDDEMIHCGIQVPVNLKAQVPEWCLATKPLSAPQIPKDSLIPAYSS